MKIENLKKFLPPIYFCILLFVLIYRVYFLDLNFRPSYLSLFLSITFIGLCFLSLHLFLLEHENIGEFGAIMNHEKFQQHISYNDSVLDFGCGCGRMTRYLSMDESIEAYGSDVNNDLVVWCQKNHLAACCGKKRKLDGKPSWKKLFNYNN